MKKLFTSIVLVAIIAIAGFAQATLNPNRLIVTDHSGNYKGFLVERIDSIIFRQIEGRVAADIDFKGFAAGQESDTLSLSITMTEDCYSFAITVMSTNRIANASDEALANYIANTTTQRYYQDFSDALLTGIDLADDADYAVLTVGFDGYGIACSVSKAEFHTPRPDVSGAPDVAWTIDNVTSSSFTISFTPNSDVSSYSMCSFGKGEAQQQFNMFGAWMGFATIADMVYAWGLPQSGPYTHTWTGMDPNKEYEVLIAAKDLNGNFADLISVPVTTLSTGGTGPAAISIEIGDFGGSAENGYYQVIRFTPNENVAIYHALIMEKGFYDENGGEANAKTVLMSDENPYGYDPYWNLYVEDNSAWNADPATTYVALAMGKNLNGEWSELAVKEYTTPGMTPASAPAKLQRNTRTFGTSEGVTKVPAVKAPATREIKLIEK